MPMKQPAGKNHPDTIQLISSIHDLQKITPAWKQFLSEHAEHFSFWQDPEIIQYHLEKTGNAKPLIILLLHENTIECVAPCLILETRLTFTFSVFHFPGPKVRLLKVLDSDFIFSRHADTYHCIETIFHVLKKQHSAFDLILLENLTRSSRLYEQCKNNKFQIMNFKLTFTSPKTEKIRKHILGDSYETWLASLKGKTRGKIRRRVRSLYKKFPDRVEFLKTTKPSHVPDFLNAINTLFPKTWQAKTFGTKTRNSDRDIAFYQHIAERGWLRSYLIQIDRKPVAFLIGFQYNGVFHHAECGYDPAFSKSGVGSVLNFLALQDLYKHDKPTELNFGFGENEYKKILGNDSCDAYEARITSPGFWRVAVKLQRFLSSTEEALRSLVKKMNMETRLRKILKRKQ
ncbi:hypothetical protein GF1_00700 [Desulfolithobacter dissulfuricans]|uniref:BioF2-like acetyltransferase domain-containing protein n=2 Tax=Desulfolithobacter dissulfuricans TaxID=2795293 RepID=A0A915TXR1_9BACT|nr:hypothetical protein GF1_00700 [Desulfolithobacter dissulfuricans]